MDRLLRTFQTMLFSKDMKSWRRMRNREKGDFATLLTFPCWPSLSYRWDLQRLREETQLQKLRARHEKHILAGYGNLGKKEDSSLLPFIEVKYMLQWKVLDILKFLIQSAKYIQVAEDIPVSAFGRPLPDLPQATFTLPWVKSSRHSLWIVEIWILQILHILRCH